MTFQFMGLMSVYIGTKEHEFVVAVRSMMAQTRPLVGLVIVVDGPVLPSLMTAINNFEQENNNFFRIKYLKKNVGLGPALNAGLALIDTEWVMRMDSDDIALPNRVETQANQIYQNPGYDVYGGQIEEFSNNQRFFRWVPLRHEEITRRMKWRNPINHVTTVYRKAAVKSVGGYSGKFILYEDYHLWCRMMARGYRFQNSRHVFVKVRFDRCQLKSRTGLSASLSELKFQKFLLDIGFIGIFRFHLNLIIRGAFRLVPKFSASLFYSNFLRQKSIDYSE